MNTDTHVRRILIYTAAVGMSMSLILFVFFNDIQKSQAVLAGLILVLANFWFLTKIVVKLLDQKYERKAFLGLLFVLKFLFVMGFVVMAFKVLKLNVIGFVLGYGSLIPVIVLTQFISGINKSAANQS